MSRPHRTPAGPQWTGEPAAPEWTAGPPASRPADSWFGEPAAPAHQPADPWNPGSPAVGAAERPADAWNPGPPAVGAAERPADAWNPGPPAATPPADEPGAGGWAADAWSAGRQAPEPWSGEPTRRVRDLWSRESAPEQPAGPWSRSQQASRPWSGEPTAVDRPAGLGSPGRSAPAPWPEPAPVERPAGPWAGEPAAEPWAGEPGSRLAEPWGGEPGSRLAEPWAGEPAERTAESWSGEPAKEPVGAGAAPRRGVRHPVRLALYVLVLFGLVAGSAAWMAVDKSVRLTVDGEARTVSTYASTVAGVLDDAGVTFSPRDLLAPAAEARVSDGAEIVLRRGRLLRLTIDGKPREVWVHATTVQEALDQVGFRQSGLFVSATRSERLPLEGYNLTVRTPKTVTVLADGRRQRVVTTAATVGQALDEAGVTVDGDDKVSQLATAAVVNGMTVTITRVTRKTTTVRTVLEYDTVEKQDADAAPGSRQVTTKGVEGLQQVTYVETYVDGRRTSRKVAKVTVLKQPVDEVVVVGPEPPPTQPAECADFPTTGGLNWCGLAKCESGLNPNAYNPAGPYYGLYQFDLGTWQSNGGTGTPSGKSIAEQTRVAYNLYQARGRSPWPTCGRFL